MRLLQTPNEEDGLDSDYFRQHFKTLLKEEIHHGRWSSKMSVWLTGDVREKRQFLMNLPGGDFRQPRVVIPAVYRKCLLP